MPVVPTSLDQDKAVRQWVAMGSGLRFNDQVIDGRQRRTPSPSGIYATVLDISEVPEGLSINRLGRGSNLGMETSIQSLTVTYSVQFFRDGARDVAREFQNWAHSPEGVYAASERGLTVYGTGHLRRMDSVDDFDWEERAGLDVSLGILTQVEHSVPLIDGVDVQVCMEGEDEADVSITGAAP